MSHPYYADAPPMKSSAGKALLRLPAGVYGVIMTLIYSVLTLGVVLATGILTQPLIEPLAKSNPMLGAVLPPLVAFAPVWVVFFILKAVSTSRGTGLSSSRFGRNAGAGYLVGLVISVGTALAIVLPAGPLVFNPRVVGDPMFWLIAVLALLAFTWQGGAEEVMMRGVLARSLGRRLGPIPVLVFTSVSFSLMHLKNGLSDPMVFVYTGLLGVFMFLLALNAGSLWIAITFHGTYNFINGFMMQAVVTQPNPFTAYIMAGTSVAGIVVMVLVLNARKPGWYRRPLSEAPAASQVGDREPQPAGR